VKVGRTTSVRPSKVSSGWHASWHCHAGPPFPPSSVVESYGKGLGTTNSLRAARPSQHGAAWRCCHPFRNQLRTIVRRFLPTPPTPTDSAVSKCQNAGAVFFIILSGCVVHVCVCSVSYNNKISGFRVKRSKYFCLSRK
jgi:hypothetical protein